MRKREYSDTVKKNLLSIIDHFDKEDRAVRERQLRMWKRLEMMWAGFSQTWWDNVAHDWRVWGLNQDDNSTNDDAYFYDKPVNVFRAYLESIIAALSVTIPPVKCSPDNAEDSLDIQTARAGDKISKLIFKHNDAPLLFVHALYVYCTQGMIAAYNYTNEDEKYGTYQKEDYKNTEDLQLTKFCKNCGADLGPADVQKSEQLKVLKQAEFDPDDDDAIIDSLLDSDSTVCPKCQELLDTEVKTKKVIITRLVGRTTAPKSRQVISVHGGLFVKVPVYARTQDEMPYLGYCYEEHYSKAIDEFEDLYDKIGPNSPSSYEPYERWARLNTQYLGDYPNNTVTIGKWWLRPWSFNVINDEHECKELRRLFPDGAYVCKVNDQFADAFNENLDDHWTITKNPLSTYLHFDPLGMLLTSIQEITNDILSLVLQTMEHGIGQTFADPSVLNFEQYRQTEATPGMIFPTKPHAGKNIKDGFYEIKTATLSGEVEPFSQRVESLGQFVSGAFPSVYGGDQSNSSRTAAQYAMSRSQALQRLQTPWKMLCFWWGEIFAKVIPAYIKNVHEDERFVEKDKMGNFVNVLITKAELEGKLGDIEVEAADQLPISWAQQQDMILKLLQMNVQPITEAITTPENAYILKETLGLADFTVPGESDRNKQYDEIQILMNSIPTAGPDGQEQSSLEPDLYLDNHGIEAHILREWLKTDAGRAAKTSNPKGYKNCLLHLKAHMDMAKQLTAPPAPPQGQVPPTKIPNQGPGPQLIKGNQNVPPPQPPIPNATAGI